ADHNTFERIANDNYNGNRVGCFFGSFQTLLAGDEQPVRVAADQVAGQLGQAVEIAFRVSRLDSFPRRSLIHAASGGMPDKAERMENGLRGCPGDGASSAAPRRRKASRQARTRPKVRPEACAVSLPSPRLRMGHFGSLNPSMLPPVGHRLKCLPI